MDEDRSIEESLFGFSRAVNEYYNFYVGVADAKAGAAGTTIGVLLVFLAAQRPSSGDVLAWCIFFLVVGACLASLISAGRVIYPRLTKGEYGLIFWEDVAAFDDSNSYAQHVLEASLEDIVGAYSKQNYYVARILAKKYSNVRSTLWLTAAALVLAVAYLVR